MLRTIGKDDDASQSRLDAIKALATRCRSAASHVPAGEWMMSFGIMLLPD